MSTIACAQFIDAILGEHRTMRALLASANSLASNARALGQAGAPPFRVVLANLNTLLVPHETRESKLLFPKLRKRCPPLGSVLDRMESEHKGLAGGLAALLARIPQGSDMWQRQDFESFCADWHQFASTVIGHMSVEESYIVPVAADFLTLEDWNAIVT